MSIANLDLRQIARALGGEISGGQVLAPGPGHSAADRSMSVKLDPAAPDGFLVNSFANDDPLVCKDYVREKCGASTPAFKPNGKRPRATRDEIAALYAAAAQQQREDSRPRSKPGATFAYKDGNGALLYEVLKFENPKKFLQRRPDGNGGWIWKLDEQRVLYKLPELLQYPDATVFVCEGEKDADRVASLGHCATTVASGKWTDECVAPLAGRDVIVLEDVDEPGRKKATAAAKALYGTAKTIRIVSLPGLTGHPDNKDVSDWLDTDSRRADKLVDICFEAPLWEPSDDRTIDSQGTPPCSPPSPSPPSPSSSPPPSSPSQPSPSQGDDPQPLPKPSPATAPPRRSRVRRHRDGNSSEPRHLIKNVVPETGVGLLSGQFGTFKTFVSINLCMSAIAGHPFAGEYRVKRIGGILYIATEGQAHLERRIDAAAVNCGEDRPLPIYQLTEVPHLLDPKGLAQIIADALEAAGRMKLEFSVDLVLIIIDTVSGAAGYAKANDENDAAVTGRVMAAMKTISDATGAFVLGVDHFGKNVEVGTRGSSNKEAPAETVLALLADKSLSGEVVNTRLALRKVRDSAAGREIPFATKVVHQGEDEDGDQITTLVVDWKAPPPQPTGKEWSKSLQLLRRILMTMLADAGTDMTPFADGPVVRAVDVELVRTEFSKQYLAEGTSRQKAAARRMAFNRAVKDAHGKGLVATREVEGVQLIWLAKTEVPV
jgi:AAA domain